MRYYLLFLLAIGCGQAPAPITTFNLKTTNPAAAGPDTVTATSTSTATDTNTDPSCTVKKIDTNTIVTCPDGSTETITEEEETGPAVLPITEGIYCGRPVVLIAREYYVSLTAGLHHLQEGVTAKVTTTCGVKVQKKVLTEVTL